MSLKDAYGEVAARSVQAAESVANANLQEAAVFKAYHAFESIGGALVTSRSQPYPRSHRGKINHFVATSRTRPYARSTAALAIQLVALRNQALYPEEGVAGVITRPKDRWTLTQAKKIVSRVRGLVNRIAADI